MSIPSRPTPVGRVNRMKQMIAGGEVPLGVLLSVPSPRVVEMCALAGADFVICDAEHHPFDWDDLENIVRACEATGITPGVRTMGLNGAEICRLLDIGFQYVTVPQVDTPEEAQALVDAALYPPMGRRGVDLTRFSGFGLGLSARDYLPIANQQIMLSLSIESVTGLKNAEAIAAIPGIDGISVGPTDLSTSMGLAGDHHHPDVLAAVERVHEVARKHGKYYGGTPLALDEVPALLESGAKAITMSLSRIIGAQIRSLSGAIRAAS